LDRLDPIFGRERRREKEFPMATSPYKRRRPSIVRNFWIYRRLVGLAIVLGLMLWFIWANNAPVTVAFPFGLGKLSSTIGLVILLSALVGSVATALTMTLIYAWSRVHAPGVKPQDEEAAPIDDRPPADYAAKASEAVPEHHWP
jgi:uncharacterized integral membrane protein